MITHSGGLWKALRALDTIHLSFIFVRTHCFEPAKNCDLYLYHIDISYSLFSISLSGITKPKVDPSGVKLKQTQRNTVKKIIPSPKGKITTSYNYIILMKKVGSHSCPQ
tara:strand:- start:409 stop:735 length:327 start_codon:yes stop_codon:yes gene_type:complete